MISPSGVSSTTATSSPSGNCSLIRSSVPDHGRTSRQPFDNSLRRASAGGHDEHPCAARPAPSDACRPAAFCCATPLACHCCPSPVPAEPTPSSARTCRATGGPGDRCDARPPQCCGHTGRAIAKKKRPMPHHREDAHRGASSPSIIEKPVSWRLGYSTPPEKVTPPGKTAMMGQFEMAPMALMPANPAFGVPGNALTRFPA
jgi:hypothetical protein